MAHLIQCDSCDSMADQNFDPLPLRTQTLHDLMDSSTYHPPFVENLEMVLDNLIFLLGNGDYSHRQLGNIKKVVDDLMWRNYPEVMKWNQSQKCVVFIPDHYLIGAPECVAPERTPKVLDNLSEAGRNEPSKSAEFEKEKGIIGGAQNRYFGDAVEMKL